MIKNFYTIQFSRIFIFCYFIVFLPNSILAQAAWNPYERQLFVRPVAMTSQYNSAFLTTKRAKYDDTVRIHTGFLTMEYGITDQWAVDGTVGFGRLTGHQLLNRPWIQSPEVEDKHGTLDGRFGVRYKITDEFMSEYSWMPTFTIRVGAIHKGDYDRNPQALGDGASGWEANLYWAKDFNFWGLGTYGEAGYRSREKPVPDDILYGWGFYKRLFENFLLILGGRGQVGQSGYAFWDPRGEPPLNYFQIDTSIFQWGEINLYEDWYLKYKRPPWGRKENFHTLEVGIGYTDIYGNFYYLWVSKVMTGYNTAELTSIGFLINFPFYL